MIVPGPESMGLLVMDLETQVDERALALLGPKESRATERSSLQRIIAGSFLFARGTEPNRYDAVSIKSFEGDETEILRKVDDELCTLMRAGGTLVTYNGKHHDLGLLRLRAQRHHEFELSGIQHWYADRMLPHRDLLTDTTPFDRRRMSPLRDVAAALGIELDHRACPRTGGFSTAIRKSQVDVAATYLVHLHDRAMILGRDEPLATGWSALASCIERMTASPHLHSFSRHPYARQWARS